MIWQRKILFFGGKGGVGKTTLSCATALLLSRSSKTLLISTDPAHSISDLLSVKGDKIARFSDSLYLLEIDPTEELENHIERALSVIENSLSPDTYHRIEETIRHMGKTPGTEEIATMDALVRVIEENYDRYDHFVVDTAPTGHTLHMIRDMTVMSDWIEELIKKRKSANKLWAAGGFSREDRGLRILEDRKRRYAWFLKEINSQRTTFIPVLTPERLPIEETTRLLKELIDLGVRVELIMVNKVLPAETKEDFLRHRKEVEKKYLTEIEERFKGYIKVRIPMMERDVSGLEDLERISSLLEEALKT